MSIQDISLAALETLELRALAWGFVDQVLEEEEAEEAIASALAEANCQADAAEVLDLLVESACVHLIRDGSSRRYRTRFAELARLFLRLRQWFDGTPWQAAPTLVSDLRLDVRARRYPRRDVAPDDAWRSIDPENRYSLLQVTIWRDLTASRSLAGFQVAACRRLLAADRGSATIVTAGTGSGKTLAFFLPAFVRAAPEVRKSQWWTKVVCIYPRQELLKDQLSEAYKISLGTASALQRDGRRPFAIGSLFGSTPRDATEDSLQQAGWARRATGFACPFLRCTVCGGEMLWSRDAIHSQSEELRCTDARCTGRTDHETLRLTRRSIQRDPPDFLFTTTEMMNQRLSDIRMRRVFGVGLPVARAPIMTLLDEAHTYAGVSGAQSALLFRRWAALLGVRMRWAGLSATLPNAAQFFGDLTGTWVDAVAQVSPSPGDFIEEGAEYHVVLRTDPSSQAATLSTSIQAVMLLARMLDRRDEERSRGRFGSRTFVFTDDLDVTHRLYDNLLDAEAYDRWRRPDPTRTPLAALRSSARPDALNREREGQRWLMAEDIRHSLVERLEISRTTSRDPGVDRGVDVIVATSALEVGFNDPNVGAVVQHKAPRSAASFLQRRGRAGRPRGMRPITVVVLSDYGRDRLAFQSYEQLFDPTVQIAALPTRNPYVLRIQAVYATLDWIAEQSPDEQGGWAWRALAGPARNATDHGFQQHAKAVIQKIIQGDQAVTERYRAHLKVALDIDTETLDSILWYPPRSLMLEALPTLARRLIRDWKLAHGVGEDLHAQDPPHPLPDFVPPNLFSDLNLPEIQIVVPGAASPEAMPIASALGQFVPGRVRRRFADQQGNISHWVPIDVDVAATDIRVDQYASQAECVGFFEGVHDGSRQVFPVFRPWEINVIVAPQRVSATSNASWSWQSSFEMLGNPTFIDMPASAGVSGVLDRVAVHLHRLGSGVSVRRFAHAGLATPRLNGQERFIRFRIVDDEQQPAAIGFVFEADALAIDIQVPDATDERLARVPPETLRWLRYLAIKAHAESSRDLPLSLNAFRRDWLHQVILLAAITVAEEKGIPLPDALSELRLSNGTAAYDDAIQALVSGFVTPDPDEDDGVPMPVPTRLHQVLANCLADRSISGALIDLVARWIATTGEPWRGWLEEVLSSTLSEAIHQACITALPQSAAAEALTVDTIGAGMSQRVIVAETTLGGGGTLEALAERFAEDPITLVRALESACAPSDHELASAGLRQVLALASQDITVSAALADLRAAVGAKGRDDARVALFKVLSAHGLPVSRTLSVLMATRLVRPGADDSTDAVSLSLFRAWDELEQRHGIALPMRVALAVIVKTSPLRDRLANIGGLGRELFTANLLMWPTGGELRQRALQSYNPYRSAPYVDAALLRQVVFETRVPVVLFGTPGWQEIASQRLATEGAVRLLIRHGATEWRAAVVNMVDAPITSGFLQFFPMVEAVRSLESGDLAVDLTLRERS